MTEKETLICLTSFVGFGPARVKLLVSYFKNAKNTWNGAGDTFIKLGLKKNLVYRFLKHRNTFNPEEYFQKLEKLSIKVITYKDSQYPKNLKEISDFPLILYVKGEIKSEDKKAMAVVGTRKMTLYGRRVTSRFVKEFVKKDLTIISGLARGVDTVAHQTTLLNNGRTIAVLGCGLDMIYPPENLSLSRRIIKHGALVSEYPLGYPIYPANFALRNRIISGLSKGILVVEGAKKSGTLLTASRAAEQGREVFAVPGPIDSVMSGAPHFLLQKGANIAIDPQGVLEQMGFLK